MDVPVLLIIFNKPDTTEKVFKAIAQVKPTTLFVAADGPRANKSGEAEECARTRTVIDKVDWPCKVRTKFSDINLGCGRHPANAITWLFEHVEQAIILEDDCVPHPTFFRFCSELLERYHNDTRVMHIAGNNFQLGNKPTKHSYFFSHHSITAGGWATWRRAWMHHDIQIKEWPVYRETPWLQQILDDPNAVNYFQTMFDRIYHASGDIDVWDYQWNFACWAQAGLSILPSVTLVSNIGFGHPNATHTIPASDSLALLTGFLKTKAMKFPLRHPPTVERLGTADRFIVEHIIVPSRKPPKGFHATIRKPWIDFLQARPSLQSPQAFWRRLRRINVIPESFRKNMGGPVITKTDSSHDQ